MARKRKRDWPVAVYKYGLMTNEGTPDLWWGQHAKYCDTWNKLVEGATKLQEGYRALFGEDDTIRALEQKIAALRVSYKTSKSKSTLVDLRISRADLKVLKTEFREKRQEKFAAHKEKEKRAVDEVIREAKRAGLYWTHRSSLRTAWETALVLSRKYGRGLPRFKSKYDRDICFLHSYTGGGAELGAIFRPNKRVYIEPVAVVDRTLPQRQWKKQCRTKVHIWMCGEEKVFNCVLHHDILSSAIVKNISITGRRFKGTRDCVKWEMSIAVEIPHEDVEKCCGDPVRTTAALELGWRHMGKELRIGVHKDESGRYKELYLPDKLLESVPKSMRLQAKKDSYLNQLRELLRDKVNPLSGIKVYFQIEPELDAQTKPRVTKLLARYKKTCGWLNHSHYHAANYREWLYYQISHKLCMQYDTIIIKDMDMKALSQPKKDRERDKEQTEAGKRAQKYRALVAVGEFREILKRVAAKYGTSVDIIPCEYTSMHHYACGHTQVDMEPKDREKLYIKCQKCGIRYDQDENSCDIGLNARRKKNGEKLERLPRLQEMGPVNGAFIG